MMKLSGIGVFALAALASARVASPNVARSQGSNDSAVWDAAMVQARAVVAMMTLEEKVNITQQVDGNCPGSLGTVPRLGINVSCFADGPGGIGSSVTSSQFPPEVAAGATFDVELVRARGQALGEEFRDTGIQAVLGPVTAGPLGRDPRGGRNWENFSPDEHLSGVLGGATIQGIQSKGVVTIAKHFIGNEQETLRFGSDQGGYVPGPEADIIDSVIDDKTLHETYLRPWAEAVRAGTLGIMCSYNKFNGELACESDFALNQLLRKELGFKGFIMSDYTAVRNGTKAALAGMDALIALPDSRFWGPLLAADVGNGTVSIDRVNEQCARVLASQFFMKAKGYTLPDYKSDAYVVGDHAKIIQKLGEGSITMLKNTPGRRGLPLSNSSLSLIGSDAGPQPSGLNPYPGGTFDSPLSTVVGIQSVGGGSGGAPAPYLVTPYEAIGRWARENQIYMTAFLYDNVTFGENPFGTFTSSFPIDVALSTTETSIVFVSVRGREGWDRKTLDLDNNGDALIDYVAATSSNTIVVVNAPGPVNMKKWIEHENVTAVLYQYYGGQEAGNALLPVLTGDVNPSGKLPFTVAKEESDFFDAITFYNNGTSGQIANFTEGNLVDYKYFDANGIEPLFPFGFGLSYTNFTYSSLKILKGGKASATPAQLTNEKFKLGSSFANSKLYDTAYTVTAKLTNTGTVAGCEAAQLYITYPAGTIGQPPRSLRGFDKQRLEKGVSAQVSFAVRYKDIAVWNTDAQYWEVPAGTFNVTVASNSRASELMGTFQLF